MLTWNSTLKGKEMLESTLSITKARYVLWHKNKMGAIARTLTEQTKWFYPAVKVPWNYNETCCILKKY